MKVITLIGADASGKDTQIELLKKHFEGHNKRVQVITIWDSLAEFSKIADKKSLHETIETFLLGFTARARSFFLLACLKNSYSKLNSSNDIVLLNGFFHKYWASEMVYGVESSLWEKNISEFAETGTTIYLKSSLENCLERKVSWSKYEQGLGKFDQESKQLGKEEFQENLHRNLDQISTKTKDLITINGDQAIEEVFKDVISKI